MDEVIAFHDSTRSLTSVDDKLHIPDVLASEWVPPKSGGVADSDLSNGVRPGETWDDWLRQIAFLVNTVR